MSNEEQPTRGAILGEGLRQEHQAMVRDALRFRKLKHAHESLGGKLVRWCVLDDANRFLPADAALDQVADALPEVET